MALDDVLDCARYIVVRHFTPEHVPQLTPHLHNVAFNDKCLANVLCLDVLTICVDGQRGFKASERMKI